MFLWESVNRSPLKIKNFTKSVLQNQDWVDYDKDIAFCRFDYQCKSWDKPRTFYGVRRVKKRDKLNFFNSGEIFETIEYEYCAFCSSLNLEPVEIYKLYNKRGECENWIENIKNQLHGCHTLTNNFWANDILWQIVTLAYNISLLFRTGVKREYWKLEHRTFYRRFIAIPGKLVKTARKTILKISKSMVTIEKYSKGKESPPTIYMDLKLIS